MIVKPVLLAVIASCMQSSTAKWTSYESDFEFECPSLHHLNRMNSQYNGRNDRKWEYGCTEGFVGEDCIWSEDMVEQDGSIIFYCGNDEGDDLDTLMNPQVKPVITGVKSRYNGGKGRIWTYKCCKLNTKPATECRTERDINKWGETMVKDFQVDRAMYGLTSFIPVEKLEQGNRGDRVWSIATCLYVGCQVRKLEVVNPIETVDEGETMIGINADQTCSSDTSTLKLYRTDSVTRTAAFTIANGRDYNWATSLEVSATLTAGFLGSGTTLSYGAEHTRGGATTIERAETDETSTGSEDSTGKDLSYQGPGAAMIIGTINRYRLNTNDIDIDVISTCGDGTEWRKTVQMNVRGSTYGKAFYRTRRATFLPGRCGSETENCIGGISGGNDADTIFRHFENCIGDAGDVSRISRM
ncbi:uncharacterized protein LOC135503182 [Lineus longissimus]|uniref:uncharacterized protein LOC135503182 n=1 Tax=Lineus longissimus TaxID=88925 RepID=UPI00315CBABC